MLNVYENLEQGSAEWLNARLGTPTASRFKDAISSKSSRARSSYLYTLAAERFTGQIEEIPMNAHMRRGHEDEPVAREMYEFITDQKVAQIGFMRNEVAGYSPDGLIGENGLLEIKSKLPRLMVEVIDNDVFPSEHKAQCQGALWVSGREWIDIAVYSEGFPLFIKRAERDEKYIESLAQKVEDFCGEIAEVVRKVESYG